MKTILVVLDGAADLPNPSLGGLTPLEAANTPYLDRLAHCGLTGLLDVVRRGIAPESDEGVLALLGYPAKEHTGRGPLEAAGLGFKPKKKCFLALRANFATSIHGRRITDRRAGRTLTQQESRGLARELNKRVKLPFTFKVMPGIAHRAVVVFEDDRPFSSKVTNTDPAYRITREGLATAVRHYIPYVQECKPLDDTPEAKRTAHLINQFARQCNHILDESRINSMRRKQKQPAANTLLLRDAGVKLPRLDPKKKGWAIIADMPLEIGIGRLSGMQVIKTPTAVGSREDYRLRARKTLEALKGHDSVYVHLKGMDVFGHNGDAKGKTKALELIDEGFFNHLWEKADLTTTRIIVTSDHSTPCTYKAHGAGPVPFLVTGAGIDPDKSWRFNEHTAIKGRGGRMAGVELLKRWLG